MLGRGPRRGVPDGRYRGRPARVPARGLAPRRGPPTSRRSRSWPPSTRRRGRPACGSRRSGRHGGTAGSCCTAAPTAPASWLRPHGVGRARGRRRRGRPRVAGRRGGQPDQPRRGDILVCGHGRRDPCCGRDGTLLAMELLADPAVRGRGLRRGADEPHRRPPVRPHRHRAAAGHDVGASRSAAPSPRHLRRTGPVADVPGALPGLDRHRLPPAPGARAPRVRGDRVGVARLAPGGTRGGRRRRRGRATPRPASGPPGRRS